MSRWVEFFRVPRSETARAGDGRYPLFLSSPNPRSSSSVNNYRHKISKDSKPDSVIIILGQLTDSYFGFFFWFV